MSPLDAMVRAHWEAGRTAGWPMLEELTDAQRYDLKEQMRAALTALRDNGVTQRMYDAAYDVRPSDNFDGIFCAMLDAALQGDSGSNGRPG